MRDYRPSSPPATDSVEALGRWAYEQLELISQAVPGEIPQLTISHNAPRRPRNGQLVYADGSDWNPGSGEGFYGYENGAWVKL